MDDLQNRFSYHPPKPGQADRYQKIRAAALDFAQLICAETPKSREQALAITHLEDTVMWTNAAIARNE
ncbi:MAG: hypothetical protein HQM00_02310 [Magnetococcales bacterium]|nr:hypothetical protein [Magnetococcales bacterium]